VEFQVLRERDFEDKGDRQFLKGLFNNKKTVKSED